MRTDGQRGDDVRVELILSADEAQQGGPRTVAGERIEVPAGIQHGATLSFSGKGEPGFAGGPRGDLFVEVRLAGFGVEAVHAGDIMDGRSGPSAGCLWWLLGGAAVAVVAAIVIFGHVMPTNRKHDASRDEQSCLVKCRQLAQAMAAYSQDWDGCLMPHQNEAGTWSTLIGKYLPNADTLVCDSARDETPPGYVYRNVAPRAVRTNSLTEPNSQVMGLDGAREGIAWRHHDGANAWFLDGHAKWLGKDTAGSQYAGLDKMGPWLALRK